MSTKRQRADDLDDDYVRDDLVAESAGEEQGSSEDEDEQSAGPSGSNAPASTSKITEEQHLDKNRKRRLKEKARKAKVRAFSTSKNLCLTVSKATKSLGTFVPERIAPYCL